MRDLTRQSTSVEKQSRLARGGARVALAVHALLLGGGPAIGALAVFAFAHQAACDPRISAWLLVTGLAAASSQMLILALVRVQRQAAPSPALMWAKRLLLVGCVASSAFLPAWYLNGSLLVWADDVTCTEPLLSAVRYFLLGFYALAACTLALVCCCLPLCMLVGKVKPRETDTRTRATSDDASRPRAVSIGASVRRSNSQRRSVEVHFGDYQREIVLRRQETIARRWSRRTAHPYTRAVACLVLVAWLFLIAYFFASSVMSLQEDGRLNITRLTKQTPPEVIALLVAGGLGCCVCCVGLGIRASARCNDETPPTRTTPPRARFAIEIAATRVTADGTRVTDLRSTPQTHSSSNRDTAAHSV